MSRGEQPFESSQAKSIESSKSAEELRTDAGNCWERTQSAITRSRQQLRQSDEIMKWCEKFGPHPASRPDDSGE
jgi:hypothetical protein